MERCIIPFGGEFWYDKSLFSSSSKNFNRSDYIFLDGGQSAIKYIIEDILFSEDEYVLLPSYLCPSMLINFDKKKIKYKFYEVDTNLRINLDSLKQLISNIKVKTILFINYFGFFHDQNTILFLKELQKKGILLVEDAVQMLWFEKMENFIGDYVFNSYRKFFPYDGSIVISPNKNNRKILKSPLAYCNKIKRARDSKTDFILNNNGTENSFLALYDEAEEAYYDKNGPYLISEDSKKALQYIDVSKVHKKRLNNYKYLQSFLENDRDVEILFHYQQIGQNIPLTFPIRVKHRDSIRKKLREKNIFCPVHWDIQSEAWARNFADSVNLSKTILSIPIDWRYGHKEIEYFVEIFRNIKHNIKD